MGVFWRCLESVLLSVFKTFADLNIFMSRYIKFVTWNVNFSSKAWINGSYIVESDILWWYIVESDQDNINLERNVQEFKTYLINLDSDILSVFYGL